MGNRWCDVTVQTPDGKRHTITVESASVYEAAMEFFGRSGATFPGDSLPPTNKDTVFEVRPIYRVTQKQLIGPLFWEVAFRLDRERTMTAIGYALTAFAYRDYDAGNDQNAGAASTRKRYDPAN